MSANVDLTALATTVVDGQPGRCAELEKRYGAIGRQRCIEDTTFHLRYLYQSSEVGDPELFIDYVSWAKTMLASRGIGEADLAENLEGIRAVLISTLNDRDAHAAGIVGDAIARLSSPRWAIAVLHQ